MDEDSPKWPRVPQSHIDWSSQYRSESPALEVELTMMLTLWQLITITNVMNAVRQYPDRWYFSFEINFSFSFSFSSVKYHWPGQVHPECRTRVHSLSSDSWSRRSRVLPREAETACQADCLTGCCVRPLSTHLATTRAHSIHIHVKWTTLRSEHGLSDSFLLHRYNTIRYTDWEFEFYKEKETLTFFLRTRVTEGRKLYGEGNYTRCYTRPKTQWKTKDQLAWEHHWVDSAKRTLSAEVWRREKTMAKGYSWKIVREAVNCRIKSDWTTTYTGWAKKISP